MRNDRLDSATCRGSGKLLRVDRGQAHQQPATRVSSHLLHHRFPASQSDAQPGSAILGGRGRAGTAVQVLASCWGEVMIQAHQQQLI
jgi:hypothetical protein